MLSTDITKCENEKCSLKKQCFRYTSKPEYWQSYALFEIKKDGTCEFFINNIVEGTT